jgi:hypothetical protein
VTGSINGKDSCISTNPTPPYSWVSFTATPTPVGVIPHRRYWGRPSAFDKRCDSLDYVAVLPIVPGKVVWRFVNWHFRAGFTLRDIGSFSISTGAAQSSTHPWALSLIDPRLPSAPDSNAAARIWVCAEAEAKQLFVTQRSKLVVGRGFGAVLSAERQITNASSSHCRLSQQRCHSGAWRQSGRG